MSRKLRTWGRPQPTVPEGGPQVRLTVSADGIPVQFDTSQPVTLIGSRRDCDLFIQRSDVSKTHCALVNTGTAIVAADLCSRTGTFVNGQCISAATLWPGDKLRVGSVPVEVHFLATCVPSPPRRANEQDPNTILSSPLRLAGASQQYELTTLPAVIGRRHASRIVLDTPDVSLAHTLLMMIEGCPALFDLGSRSGTFLNGRRVTLAWLRDGDRLCIGGEELSLAWDGQCAATLWCEEPPTDADAPDVSSADDGAGTGAAKSSGKPAGTVARPGTTGSSSEGELRKLADALEQREAELEARYAALEAERARLAIDEQQCGHRVAEIDAASGASRPRECTPDQPCAAPATADQPTADIPGAEKSADQPGESDPGGPNANESSPNGDLPAPLVGKPLFDALDPGSPGQWPEELQKRLRFLRLTGHGSNADAISRVLAEYQARWLNEREPPDD